MDEAGDRAKPPLSRQGTTVHVHMSMDVQQQSDHKLTAPSGMELLVLSPKCSRREVPSGVNLNRYTSSGSWVPWHSDNESLFGPQNSPKLIVSMSLGYSVEFHVRRAPGDVPSSIWLDHGDVLVVDGLAQLEYDHRTASGLQGHRVNLTFRWITQHHLVLSTSRCNVLCSAFVRARFGRARSLRDRMEIINGSVFG